MRAWRRVAWVAVAWIAGGCASGSDAGAGARPRLLHDLGGVDDTVAADAGALRGGAADASAPDAGGLPRGGGPGGAGGAGGGPGAGGASGNGAAGGGSGGLGAGSASGGAAGEAGGGSGGPGAGSASGGAGVGAGGNGETGGASGAPAGGGASGAPGAGGASGGPGGGSAGGSGGPGGDAAGGASSGGGASGGAGGANGGAGGANGGAGGAGRGGANGGAGGANGGGSGAGGVNGARDDGDAGPPPPPLAGPGEVVFSELMYDPDPPLVEDDAEWLELTSTAAAPRSLQGCVLSDAAGNHAAIGAVEIGPGARVLFARSADPGANGGLPPVAGTFGFALNNSGRETVALRCGDALVDEVAYVNADWHATRHALSLDPARTAADANDEPSAWCLAEEPYFGDDAARHFGTPGAPNPSCPAPDPCVPDPCGPDEVCAAGVCIPPEPAHLPPGAVVFSELLYDAAPSAQWFELANTTHAAVDLAGCTVTDAAGASFDLAQRIPADGHLLFAADAGLNPDGALPFALAAHDRLALDCFGALVDAVTWDDGGAFPATRGAPISLDTLDAAANDDGAHWCLAPATPGRPNAPCPVPPPPCDPACPDGEACVAGVCTAPPPAPGEVVFSEVLYDPHDGLDDDTAEWIELQSTADGPRDLGGCVVGDAGGGHAALAVHVPARGRVLLARSADPARNGGLPPVAGTFGFSLNNGPETLTLRCGDALLDTLHYDDGGAFPHAHKASISLDPAAFDPVANDDGARWCLGAAVYTPPGVAEHRGTPGAPNPACVP
jgi:hypothetical protein